MNPALVISSRDNVATALEPLEPGRTISPNGASGAIVVAEAIPRGHKLALRAIRRGEAVVKYGSPIGTASADIAAGAHVHTHNVASARGRGDLPSPPDSVARIAEPPDPDADADLEASANGASRLNADVDASANHSNRSADLVPTPANHEDTKRSRLKR